MGQGWSRSVLKAPTNRKCDEDVEDSRVASQGSCYTAPITRFGRARGHRRTTGSSYLYGLIAPESIFSYLSLLYGSELDGASAPDGDPP